jgi:thiamine-phosphate pyrophosphorylase
MTAEVARFDGRFPYRFLQLSDATSVSPDVLRERVARMNGRYAVVLRDPELTTRALLDEGRVLRRLTLRVGAGLFVADRLDLALLLEADGVHLGRGSVSTSDARAIVGQRFVVRSAHDDDELAAAYVERPDAVLLSPIFTSPGKTAPIGVARLTAARASLPSSVALVALGGVKSDRVGECLDAGADGVASIRADLTGYLAGAGTGFTGTSRSRR